MSFPVGIISLETILKYSKGKPQRNFGEQIQKYVEKLETYAGNVEESQKILEKYREISDKQKKLMSMGVHLAALTFAQWNKGTPVLLDE